MRVAIVDDEPPARARLRALLAAHDDVEIVAECEDADAAIRAIGTTKPDLVFLDVQMPGFDGFQLLDALQVDPAPAVIFVTAHAHHAVRAFDAAAVDYLLKPFDDQRLVRALDRFRSAGRANEDLATDLRRLMDQFRDGAGTMEQIPVTLGRRTIFLRPDEVDWIEASGNYLRLHVETSYHLIRATISHFEKRLDPRRFARIHRSVIVQRSRIRELRLLDNGEYRVVLTTGVELPMSRTYRDRLPR